MDIRFVLFHLLYSLTDFSCLQEWGVTIWLRDLLERSEKRVYPTLGDLKLYYFRPHIYLRIYQKIAGSVIWSKHLKVNNRYDINQISFSWLIPRSGMQLKYTILDVKPRCEPKCFVWLVYIHGLWRLLETHMPNIPSWNPFCNLLYT